MGWTKGQSGNPHGRPTKSRALTEILETAGSHSLVDIDGKRRSGKRVLARMMWEIITIGEASFPGGKKLVIAPVDWLAVAKWLYSHIDGPPKAELDVTSGGKSLLDIEEWKEKTIKQQQIVKQMEEPECGTPNA